MRLFECQHCRQPLFFENDKCDSCGRHLGYIPELGTMSAVEPDGDRWKALADSTNLYRFCANTVFDACNWLVLADSPETFCAACRHNRMIPDLSVPQNVTRWRKIETAKHRLFYTLVRLYLPRPTRTEEPESGLAFDFLQAAAPSKPVMTGHASGLITLSLSEADDSERERQRNAMEEPYRTLLGHFRHEIGHYYWDLLVRDPSGLDEFRRVFGDEREDYGAALKSHYEKGAPLELAAKFRVVVCERAPVGRLRGNLGALFSHDRHLGDRRCVRNSSAPAGRQEQRSHDHDRFRSAPGESRNASSTPGCR